MPIPYYAAAALLLMATPVCAQGFAPDDLPASTGRVAQYSLTPRGDVDGLILEDGTEIHLPPHLGPQLIQVVKPGDVVAIRGLRARAIPMVQAVEITNQATGRSVTDSPGAPAAPPPDLGTLHPISVAGTIRSQLHGPKGDLNGVLLSDGTMIHLPPGDAARLASLLQPGAPLAVVGNGLSSPLGQVVAATRIGATPDQTTPLAEDKDHHR